MTEIKSSAFIKDYLQCAHILILILTKAKAEAEADLGIAYFDSFVKSPKEILKTIGKFKLKLLKHQLKYYDMCLPPKIPTLKKNILNLTTITVYLTVMIQ